MARRRGEPEKDDSKRYLETFSDLMSLLLVFFILLFAFGQADLERFKLLSSSLRAAFNGVSVFAGGLGFADGFDATGMNDAGANLVNLGSLPSRDQDYLKVQTILSQFAAENGLEGEIAINVGREGIYISLSSALLFPSGSPRLTEEGERTLQVISKLLNELPNDIRVEAHTDNTPSDNPLYPTNWELSAARAVTVVRYLEEVGNVAGERMAAVGMGEYHPLYPNDTPEHRRLNRRADILILYPPEEEPPIIDLRALFEQP